MTGPCVGPHGGATLPIDVARRLKDGTLVFIVNDGEYVKMVSEKKEVRYYAGTSETFDPNDWEKYPVGGDGTYIHIGGNPRYLAKIIY